MRPVILVIVAFLGISAAALFAATGVDARRAIPCEAKGGTVLRVPGGTICARVEVIKP